MRVARLVLSVCISFLLPVSLTARQTATSSPQALLLLQRSLGGLAGGQTITDVTLSGTARLIAGSDDESGTGRLKAIATDASRMDLNLSSGPRTEIQNASGSAPVGSWSATDGVSHPISFHNLLVDPSWFFPAFPIAHGLSSAYVATYIDHETRNDQAVEHLTISQALSTPASADSQVATRLSRMDIFLYAKTFLPASIAFVIHPDNDAGLDIPVESRFSDYRAVSGAQVPFQVQKYLNNSLVLDFQADSVTLNTGLPASAFRAQ